MESKKLDLMRDKKGVFGLSAIQTFFVMILGIALIAYVIIVILGALQNSTILTPTIYSVANETNGYLNSSNVTGNYTLKGDPNSVSEYSYSIISIVNASAGNNTAISPSLYALGGGAGSAPFIGTGVAYVYNTSVVSWTNVSIAYTYLEPTSAMYNSQNLIANTSSGVTSFFSSITPVYAILAILVIILVLVVLVKVVQAPAGQKQGVQL